MSTLFWTILQCPLKYCPIYCSRCTLSPEEEERFVDYQMNGGYIQDALSSLNLVEREFLKSGYCPKCQEILFWDGKTKRIKKAKIKIKVGK